MPLRAFPNKATPDIDFTVVECDVPVAKIFL